MGWLEYCKKCGRKHRMKLTTCPSCGGRSGEQVPNIVSDKVANSCRNMKLATGECTGCEAYREHLY